MTLDEEYWSAVLEAMMDQNSDEVSRSNAELEFENCPKNIKMKLLDKLASNKSTEYLDGLKKNVLRGNFKGNELYKILNEINIAGKKEPEIKEFNTTTTTTTTTKPVEVKSHKAPEGDEGDMNMALRTAKKFQTGIDTKKKEESKVLSPLEELKKKANDPDLTEAQRMMFEAMIKREENK